MKIFSMNDCDWVAGKTLDEAKIFYAHQVAADHYDVDSDPDGIFEDPHELTDAKLDALKFNGDPEEPMKNPITFREQLTKMIADGERFPCFFASTEY